MDFQNLHEDTVSAVLGPCPNSPEEQLSEKK